jgi:hypothetical protein
MRRRPAGPWCLGGAWGLELRPLKVNSPNAKKTCLLSPAKPPYPSRLAFMHEYSIVIVVLLLVFQRFS